ncbi:SAM-dependent methyltransferase [Mycolicibacterium agri]|uniref:SAM-dependent methyltransferase n=2 Tax=Mycolicibacterium agri TaxID=36811 RepID=A0A2A7MYT8_MYCAG|nr:SAM-dependent methyltransferase [Mycolicibacterium agri]
MDSATFTASSRLQAAGLRPAIELFEQAAQVVPLPKQPYPIVIADYGASTGHNSLLPISAALSVLRGRTRPEHSILVVHTDLPDNNFTVMFETLNDDPDTYLRKDAATFASAVGRSFYGQIIPSNSVHLGWSSWAVQWLSQVPAPVPDHVHIAYSADQSVRTAYAKQAARDWHEFVAFRGRELCPGGKLVVLTMGVGEDGEFGHRHLLTILVDVLAELVADGLLTEDETRGMCLPIVGRSEAQFLAPFAPSGRFERLSVEHLEVFDAEDRFWNQYQVDGDAQAFGALWAGFVRAAVFPTLATALAGGRGDPRVSQFYDRLEAGISERLAAAPEPTHIPLAKLVLTKHRRTL